jgi:uncharacterized MAPEG superfamily protein
MKTEIQYLVYVTALTGLMWVPYVLDRFVTWGIGDTVGYPAQPKPQSPWAERLLKAHRNAVENLVVFAALVLAANAVGASGPAVADAAVLYFWSRVVHVLAYTFAVPWLRTLGFLGGFAAQAIVACQILAR